MRKFLKKIEEKFDCEFLQADVYISGYAVRKSKVDYYSGTMDAIAWRKQNSPEDSLKVFVVDWKSKDVADLATWWDYAQNFKTPLYQCLLYRELLQMHLKLNEIKAQVGIMIVPFQQSNPELLKPGLCLDFTRMDNSGLLDGLKKYQWFPSESSCVHTITLPCNLFKDDLDACNNILKENNTFDKGARLTDVFSEDATIGMLCEELGLLQLKVEKKEGGKKEKDNGKDRNDEREEEEEGETLTRSRTMGMRKMFGACFQRQRTMTKRKAKTSRVSRETGERKTRFSGLNS